MATPSPHRVSQERGRKACGTFERKLLVLTPKAAGRWEGLLGGNGIPCREKARSWPGPGQGGAHFSQVELRGWRGLSLGRVCTPLFSLRLQQDTWHQAQALQGHGSGSSTGYHKGLQWPQVAAPGAATGCRGTGTAHPPPAMNIHTVSSWPPSQPESAPGAGELPSQHLPVAKASGLRLCPPHLSHGQ